VQLHLAPADAVDGGWQRYARCGGWNPDAPDPEIFHALDADSDATYLAQTFCDDCPVRRYCDAWADEVGEVGVWGGIYRDAHRRVAPLCGTLGCLRYRQPGRDLCRACQRTADAALVGGRELEVSAA
jgi:hypothetical protein